METCEICGAVDDLYEYEPIGHETELTTLRARVEELEELLAWHAAAYSHKWALVCDEEIETLKIYELRHKPTPGAGEEG